MKKIMCMTNDGELFEKGIAHANGELNDPLQTIPCSDVTDRYICEDSSVLHKDGYVVATVAEETNVFWRGEHGDEHCANYAKGQKLFIPQKFISEFV